MGNLNITPIVFRIVVLNVIVFVLLNLNVLDYFGLNADSIYNHFFLLHKSNLLGIRPIGNTDSQFLPVQLITHFFAHSGFTSWAEDDSGIRHILLNMWVLVNFGPAMEKVMRAKRFLAFYLFCGIVGGMLVAFIDPTPEPVVGASGAIMGVMTGFALYFPEQKLTLFIPIPITLSVKKYMMFFGGISALFVILGALNIAPSITGGISHFGHLAGMVAALIFFYSGIGRYIPYE